MGIEIECPKCGHWNSVSTSICKGRFRRGPNKGKACEFARLKKSRIKATALNIGRVVRRLESQLGLLKPLLRPA